MAFANPRCIVNCVVSTTVYSFVAYIDVNVTDLNGSVVAFQFTVTNTGANATAPSRFYLLGGEAASIIFYPTYLNTSYLENTTLPPLAPAPSPGNNVTVTLFLVPYNASNFLPTRGEFFWLHETPVDFSAQSPQRAVVSINFGF